MTEPSTTLLAPQLSALYEWLAPWSYALLRTVIGIALVPHGLRSCFGWFPHSGRVASFAHMASEMDASGYHPGRLWAVIAGLIIFIAGPLLAVGLFTRPAAIVVCVFMLLATIDHARIGGYFCNQNGLEYPLMWSIGALFFAVHGGGTYSLDRLLLTHEF